MKEYAVWFVVVRFDHPDDGEEWGCAYWIIGPDTEPPPCSAIALAVKRVDAEIREKLGMKYEGLALEWSAYGVTQRLEKDDDN